MTPEQIAALVASAVQQALSGSKGVSPVVSEFQVSAPVAPAREARVEINPLSGYTGYLVTEIRKDENGKAKSKRPSYWVVLSPQNRGVKYQRFNASVSYAVEFFHGMLGDTLPTQAALYLAKFLLECWMHPGAASARSEDRVEVSFPEAWIAQLRGAGLVS